MKHIYLSLFLIAMSFGSVQAQNEVSLDIQHMLGDQAFAFFQDAEQSSFIFELDRLQYYISDIAITHDGGTQTDIEDVWLLINSSSDDSHSLGSWDINEVESISFHIGVGPDVNNEDPAAWPQGHPLYPQNPSMHWGWASGYRFVAMEGMSGSTDTDQVFEIHALGNDYYYQTSVDVSAQASSGELTIPIVADYVQALNDMDLSGGTITHGSFGVAITLLQNFSTDVFTAGVVSSVEEYEFDGDLTVSPNPSEGAATLNLSIPTGEDYSLRIIDMNGRAVESMGLNVTTGTVELPELSSGLYLIELQQAGKPLTAIRWSVK